MDKGTIKLPKIGFGTFPQEESLVDSAICAIKTGYKLFDISDNYCNEHYLGKAIEISRKDNPSQFIDNNITIISKFSQPGLSSNVVGCFDESKNKLDGKLDIYLLHWPYPFLWKELWKQMEMLYLKGNCKGIGVCNFNSKRIKELLSFCRVKPVINQIERHPLFQQNEIVEICKNNGIQIMSYSPVARKDEQLFSSVILKEIATKYNKTISQIILRWNIDTDTIPIPGSSSEKHIKENFDIFDFELTEKEIRKINTLECGKRIRYNPDTRFSVREKYYFLKVRLKMIIKDKIRLKDIK